MPARKKTLQQEFANNEAQKIVYRNSECLAGEIKKASPDYKRVDALMAGPVNLRHTSNGLTMMMIAVSHGHVEMVRRLMDKGIKPDSKNNTWTSTCLTVAIDRKDAAMCRQLLKSKTAICAGDVFPLHRAARKGEKQIIDLLLSAGADIDMPDRNGQTPLVAAIIAGNNDSAKYLLSCGASINARDKYGRLPMWFAVEYKNNEMVDDLARRQAQAGRKIAAVKKISLKGGA